MGVNRMLYQGAQAKRFSLTFYALPSSERREPGLRAARSAMPRDKRAGQQEEAFEEDYVTHVVGAL